MLWPSVLAISRANVMPAAHNGNMAPASFLSSRTSIDDSPNALSVALGRARAAGKPILDLTVSNPTRAGIDYDERAILGALAPPRSLDYDPAPFGMSEARVAVADHLSRSGAPVDASHVVLTASTSEAYAFLFKLLA